MGFYIFLANRFIVKIHENSGILRRHNERAYGFIFWRIIQNKSRKQLILLLLIQVEIFLMYKISMNLYRLEFLKIMVIDLIVNRCNSVAINVSNKKDYILS